MDKNLTDLEFRFLCFLSLFTPSLPKNEYIAELLNISTEKLITVINNIKEKGYIKK
ncbi:helix-turn-helix domain-containing protein [Brachyspira hampsonii]|uniref:helix-turn-helix domain-containing protein n=1 Tax=Brachyspira hampsonii TaxID=1287055 RepID=UPI00159F1CAF|nr:helix-turn-helix domain-containing protein [Brachyspira hampsonii]